MQAFAHFVGKPEPATRWLTELSAAYRLVKAAE